MNNRRGLLLTLFLSLMLAACGGAGGYADHETFVADARHHQDYSVSATTLCAAARRAMLSDGYIVTRADDEQLLGGKEFQVNQNQHAIINLYVNCEPRAGGATLFVTATEEHFDVMTSRQSSSVGFPVLAPIYFGTVLENDKQVKIRGETVTQSAFYESYYRAVQRELGGSR